MDLIFTDAPALIRNVQVLPPIATSDHCPVTCHILLKITKQPTYKRHIWLYDRADVVGFHQQLSNTPWHIMFSTTDNANEAAGCWTDLFFNVVKDFIPNKIVTVRPNDKPWVDNELKRSIKQRDRLWRKFKHTRDQQSFNIFKQARNLVVSMNRQKRNQYLHRVQESLSGPAANMKTFWGAFKALTGSKRNTAVPPLVRDGALITNPVDKAEAFNSYFSSQCHFDTSVHYPPLPTPYTLTNCVMAPFYISAEEVYKTLQSLNINKANGADGISNRMLKMASVEICSPLADLFNYCLLTECFPDCWKRANVSPVHKKDERNCVSNYRPISLLSSVSKVFERLVYNKLYSYLMTNHLLTPNNAGFKRNQSTTSQLLLICEKIYRGLENKKHVRMVFLDASKAFDKVWHDGLLYKLKQLGLCQSIVNWFQSYLHNRYQRVVLEGYTSSWLPIYTGVPQGSILGPLLFLIYTNDIVNNIKTDIYLFADDTSLLSVSDDPESSAMDLNADLKCLHMWAKQWRMSFNPIKTFSMSFTLSKAPLIVPPLYLGGQKIVEVSCHTHLGLTLTSTLNWGSHIANLSTKVSKRLGMLQCLKYSLSRSSLDYLYNTLILSLFDYADIIYYPNTVTLNQQIESLHLKGARIVTGAMISTNRERLLHDELGWNTLATRREMHMLLYLFKILHGLAPSYFQQFLPRQSVDIDFYNLRHVETITPIRCRTNLYKSSFFPASVGLWNSLPRNISGVDELSTFRSLIKHHMLSPKPPDYYGQGPRYLSILHTRLRLGHNALNNHLFKIGIANNSLCQCGTGIESEHHFLMVCFNYTVARHHMLNNIHQLVFPIFDIYNLKRRSPCSVTELLLGGSSLLSTTINIQIFTEVCKFIHTSGRFQQFS